MGYYILKHFKRGDWITNHCGSLKSFWPRRNVLYKEGPPKETEKYSVDELINQGIVGIYLEEDVVDYYSLNQVYPKQYKYNEPA